jgi:TfoX/Sxy family transcriptional regulator of competence genes
MATSAEFIEYVCGQIEGTGAVRSRKMFGEYMVYVNDKPVLLVCDNTVFVKKLDAVAVQMADAETGFPYPGAKEHYVLDIEDAVFSREIVAILEKITPIPVPKKRKAKKPDAN